MAVDGGSLEISQGQMVGVITNVLIGRLSYHWTVPSLLERFSAAERALAVRAPARLDVVPQALQGGVFDGLAFPARSSASGCGRPQPQTWRRAFVSA
jgi:hypothetical protein